jgi:hypothetical protein
VKFINFEMEPCIFKTNVHALIFYDKTLLKSSKSKPAFSGYFVRYLSHGLCGRKEACSSVIYSSVKLLITPRLLLKFTHKPFDSISIR